MKVWLVRIYFLFILLLSLYDVWGSNKTAILKDFIIASYALLSLYYSLTTITKYNKSVFVYGIFLIFHSFIFALIYSSIIPIMGMRVAILPFVLMISFYVFSKEQLKKIIDIMGFLFIFYSLLELTIFRHLLNEALYGVPRLSALTGNPNQFGVICLLYIIYYINLWQDSKTYNRLIMSGIYTILLFLTYSRECYLAAIATLIYVFFRGDIRQKYKYIVMTIIAVPLISLVGIESSRLLGKVLDRFSSIFNIFHYTTANHHRLFMWDYTIKRFLNFKYMLFGSGFGTFGGYVSMQYTAWFVENLISESHYLKILGEGGLVGLILFVAIFVSLAFIKYKKYIIRIFLAPMFIVSFFGNTFDGFTSNIVFFLMVVYIIKLDVEVRCYEKSKSSSICS